jgi:phage terminase Nu1 subunit (DNA packaging protein)
MTGNTFAPAAVARAVELILRGETRLRPTIRREFPQLTRADVDRVVDLAWQEIAGQMRDGRAA